MAVLKRVNEKLDAVIIDGCLMLGDNPVLGYHVWEKLGEKVAVIGVAKTLFGNVNSEKIFKQVLFFMVDGTRRHLTYFDQLVKDAGYAGCIETDEKDLVSSHRAKRFFKAFFWTRVFLFRRLLQTLFIWRLRIEKPDVEDLGIDTMVMDNGDANCRHGVEPTYKSKSAAKSVERMVRCACCLEHLCKCSKYFNNHCRSGEIIGQATHFFRMNFSFSGFSFTI